MASFEWIILLLFGAVLLTVLAKKIATPYPTLLAVGGAVLAFVPSGQTWTLDPELALALFVAPVLLDTAYDTSLRDLRRNWIPVAGLVFVAVGLTTTAVAIIARWLVPDMSWPVAIALGAIVAPPDAAAVTAVLRTVRIPYRALKVLEGESLLNDVTALMTYRLAVGAALAGSFSIERIAPTLALTIVGSLVAGPVLAFITMRFLSRFEDAPSSIIMQFVTTFGIWLLAEHIGLSGILTIVVYAMFLSRRNTGRMPARLRVPSYAVWETVVFTMNVLAFVFIGLQLRPIWERLSAGMHREYLIFAGIIVVTVILIRFAWIMIYAVLGGLRLKYKKTEGTTDLGRAMRAGTVLSWCGMRGIVTLAAAFALPEQLPGGAPFPYRDLILLSAFAVVVGTLVIQGLTLKPLIALMRLTDVDLVGKEVKMARTTAYRAALREIDGEQTDEADVLRREYHALLRLADEDPDGGIPAELPADPLRRRAIEAARGELQRLRFSGEIGDDAYNLLEQEFDWAELSADTAA